MRNNPGHVVVFGTDSARRYRDLYRMFTALFAVMSQERICAVDGDTIVGFMAITGSGGCQPTPRQTARMAVRSAVVGPRTLARIGAWQRVWHRYDPAEPHSHFGPLAVDAHLQGRGIGSQLLGDYTRRLDEAGHIGYLETDKPENVRSTSGTVSPSRVRRTYSATRAGSCAAIDERPMSLLPTWFSRG